MSGKNLTIAVTGANGYIGSKVVKKLCDDGHSVFCVDMDNAHVDPRAHFVAGNIFDGTGWYQCLGDPDVVLHLAWRDGFRHDSSAHMEDLPKHEAFLKGLIGDGLSTLAMMGTMHEVGYHVGAVDENTPCHPQTPYGKAKNALRESMAKYCEEKGVTLIYLRGFYIYGDDEFGNSVFCKVLKAAREGKTEFPFTEGTNKYDFLPVHTFVDQIVATITQKEVAGIINCCSGKPISLREKMEQYIQENGLSISLVYGQYPDRPYDSPCIYGDPRKINAIMRDLEK